MRVVAAAVLAAMTMAAPAAAEERKLLVIASGDVAGYYYPVAGALCRVINKDHPRGWTCVVQPTAGSAANVALLKSGDADLAILQSRAAMLALAGGEGFKDGAVPELRALMALHGEAALALTKPGSGIEQMAGLKGKRVNLGRPGSFQRMMADEALSAAGISEGDLAAAVELDVGDAAGQLCEGNLDAAFFSGVHPMAEAAAAIEQCAAQPVPLAARALDAKVRRDPWLSRVTIKGETYEAIRDDQPALAVKAVLVATTRLPAEDAYDLLKTIHANFAALLRLHPVLRQVAKGEAERDGIAIPVHDGAAKLFGEMGLAK